ncbi:MAG: hypothetical protein M3O28_06895 [Actinomycetota bacterium]|nr:hypothetical protein [Actinomycetota bacterium]
MSPKTTHVRKPATATDRRQRLRDAQAAEARALTQVGLADGRVANATRRLTNACRDLGAARQVLCSISGIDRAATLLGLGRGELRRSLTTHHDDEAAAQQTAAHETEADERPPRPDERPRAAVPTTVSTASTGSDSNV